MVSLLFFLILESLPFDDLVIELSDMSTASGISRPGGDMSTASGISRPGAGDTEPLLFRTGVT